MEWTVIRKLMIMLTKSAKLLGKFLRVTTDSIIDWETQILPNWS